MPQSGEKKAQIALGTCPNFVCYLSKKDKWACSKRTTRIRIIVFAINEEDALDTIIRLYPDSNAAADGWTLDSINILGGAEYVVDE